MHRYLTLLFVFFSLIFMPNINAQKQSMTFAVPDFSMPKDVITNARANLSIADKAPATTGPGRVRALIELCAAQTMIDRDSTFAQPAMIAAQAATPGIDAPTRAMLLTLQAKLLKNIYQQRRYVYDQVAAPDYPLPDKVAEWSGRQFGLVIDSLIHEAIKAIGGSSEPVTTYAPCLDYNDSAVTYLPTVADFIYAQGISYLEDFGFDTGNPFTGDILKLAAQGLAKAQISTAPYFYWEVENIRLNNKKESETAKLIKKLYLDNIDVEAARYALTFLCDNDITEDERISIVTEEDSEAGARKIRDERIALIKNSLEKFPDWQQNDVLKNTLAQLTRAKMEVNVKSRVMPGKTFSVSINCSFVSKGEVSIYRLPSDKRYISEEEARRTGKRLDTKTFSCTATDTTLALPFTVAEPGAYAIVGTLVSPKEHNGSLAVIRADVIDAINVGVNGENATIAVDFHSGAPLRNVKVSLQKKSYRRDTKTSTKYLGQTDKDGILRFTTPEEQSGYTNYLTYKYKGHNYDFHTSIRPEGTIEAPGTRQQAFIFTDRPLYHPGDSINWAVAVGKDKDGVSTAMSGTKLTVRLYDANSQEAGSTEVTTDANGRAIGTFATKKDVLTGQWRIRIYDGEKLLSGSSVMVSDFKLPTFHADITSVERGIPSAGSVRLTGKATTFSGMPVAGAKVDATVFEAARRLYFFRTKELGKLSAMTDESGTFTVDIPATLLAKAENNNRNFTVQFVVTASDASTAETENSFTTGKPYILINESVAQNIDTSDSLSFTPQAYNADGAKATIAIKWTIAQYKNGKAGTNVLDGAATSGVPVKIDLGKIPAGIYALSTAPADTTLADASDTEVITMYNVARNEIPAEAPRLFVPKTNFKLDENGMADIIVGINADNVYLYEAVRLDSALATVKMHRLPRGFHSLKINVPVTTETAAATLLSTCDGDLETINITLVKHEPKKARIIAESFRDRLTPGAAEHWRLRLVDGSDKGMASAAMIATMYNRALEELSRPVWPSTFGFSRFGLPINVYNTYYGIRSYVIWAYVHNVREKDIEWPQFKFIGDFYGRRIFRANAMMKSSAVVTEEAVEVADMAAADTSGAVAVEDYAFEKAEESEEYAGEKAGKKFDYRVSEVLQAFWMPSLTADADGNIDLHFTVPNANGTWTFRATGWDKSWQSANYAAECIANKPVMVAPNLPRFLRAGDKARVLANVYNNTANQATVDVTVELFNITDGTVTAESHTTLTLDAKGSGLAAIDVDTPADVTAIGYRVRATSDNFADGEQTAIPVLASSATVIESTEFYLNPGDSKPFTLTVKADDKAGLTLQYCQNPVWTVVKAMRGISSTAGNTSTSLVGQLFSALAGKGVIGENPTIAAAVGQWSKNPEEDALTSMLAKNEGLKKLLLDQTPWVQAAANESQRMQSLAQFLDPDKTEANINACTEALAKLQNIDGGFVWGSWSKESSWWCTEAVLTTLGIANSLGLLPTDNSKLNGMLQPAYNYLQKMATRPDMPKTDRGLALISVMLPQLKTNAAARKIIDNTVAHIAARWKKDNATDKAYDILILKGHNHAATADIFASLQQFAVERKDMGLCFPSVNDIRAYAAIIQAYAAMNAPREQLDALRQWVIIRAQATDDLGAYNPDYVIAALMFTGSDWTAVPVEQNVTVDGSPLVISKMESATGYFAQQIDATGRKVTVTVTPNGVTPSYGSVVSVSRRPMTGIKSKAGKDISVEKRVLVERDGAWVETNSFRLGERVRVQLTISAGRTLEYVSIDDERPATFEPVDQMPGFIFDGGLGFYRENLDASTRMFIGYMPKGTYHVTYDMTAAVAGSFMSGIATLQSQYAPELTAHSASAVITVE